MILRALSPGVGGWYGIYPSPCFPGGLDHKESACNARDLGQILGSGRTLEEGNGYSLQYFLSEFHAQRILVGYSPGDSKESDMTDN